MCRDNCCAHPLSWPYILDKSSLSHRTRCDWNWASWLNFSYLIKRLRAQLKFLMQRTKLLLRLLKQNTIGWNSAQNGNVQNKILPKWSVLLLLAQRGIWVQRSIKLSSYLACGLLIKQYVYPPNNSSSHKTPKVLLGSFSHLSMSVS